MNGEPEPPKPKPELTFKAIVSGSIKGCYNVHGIADDTSLAPPSLDFRDWELLNGGSPVVRHQDLWGQTRCEPMGFYYTGNLALFYNGSWGGAQRGCLLTFNDDFSYKDYPKNPVLRHFQSWQGESRVNPYSIWHDGDHFYTIYGDRQTGASKYTGIRALGIARSKDLMGWEYISKNEPLFTYDDFKRLAPSDLVQSNGDRVYVHGATFHNGRVYTNLRGGNADTYYRSILISSSTPANRNSWKLEYNKNYGSANPPIYIKGKWYRADAMRRDENGDRAVGIQVTDKINEIGETHKAVSYKVNIGSGSQVLFCWKGKWHIAYRQADSDGNRDMYIARER